LGGAGTEANAVSASRFFGDRSFLQGKPVLTVPAFESRNVGAITLEIQSAEPLQFTQAVLVKELLDFFWI
jgi:hypothetical protein